MNESLSSLKEGYIYKSPLDISGLWIYLGLFNYLEAKPLGNGLYKCEVINNKPKFIANKQRSMMVSRIYISDEIKAVGCTLEDINTIVESHKKEFCDYCRSSIVSIQNIFNTSICKYIAVMTLSKGNIELPSSFEIVSSYNNSLILYIPNSLN
jgi:hypothetical protein